MNTHDDNKSRRNIVIVTLASLNDFFFIIIIIIFLCYCSKEKSINYVFRNVFTYKNLNKTWQQGNKQQRMSTLLFEPSNQQVIATIPYY